jgi:hypothetical protein
MWMRGKKETAEQEYVKKWAIEGEGSAMGKKGKMGRVIIGTVLEEGKFSAIYFEFISLFSIQYKTNGGLLNTSTV